MVPQPYRYKYTPSGNRNAESVNNTCMHTPCGYLRTVSSTVAVDTSWNSQNGCVNCFQENWGCMPKIWHWNFLERIRKTYFSPAKNIDVVGLYIYVIFNSFEAHDYKRKNQNETEGQKGTLTWECLDFCMFLDVWWLWVTNKPRLSVCLITFRCDNSGCSIVVRQTCCLSLGRRIAGQTD